MTVKITLRHPPGTTLHGKVKELVAGQALTLKDGVVHQYLDLLSSMLTSYSLLSLYRCAVGELGCAEHSHPRPGCH